MSKITLDPDLKAKLNGLNEHLEICDESGTIVGRFLPEADYKELIIAWAKADLSDEEFQRRLQQPGGRTLKEIWNDLEVS